MDKTRRFGLCLGTIIGILVSTCGMCAAQVEDAEEVQKKWEQKRHAMAILQQVIDEMDVGKELEIVASQKSEIKDLFKDFKKIAGELSKNHRVKTVRLMESEKPESEKLLLNKQWESELQNQLIKAADGVSSRLEEIFLPDQLTRIRQIILQNQLFTKADGKRTELFAKLSNKLDLSREEEKEFKNALSAIQEKFNKELAALVQKHDKEILKALPSDAAREKAKELLGKIYLKGYGITF